MLDPSPDNTAVILIQIAALVIGTTAGLALSYEFDTHWYFALLGGAAAYIVALVLVAMSVGYLSGQVERPTVRPS